MGENIVNNLLDSEEEEEENPLIRAEVEKKMN
jgi:hypothetical protein